MAHYEYDPPKLPDHASYHGYRSCHTSTRVVKFAYTWTLDNYSCRTELSGEAIQSPNFEIPGCENVLWHLAIYPRGRHVSDDGPIVICLNFSSGRRIWVKYEFSILNPEGKKLYGASFPPTSLPRSENFIQNDRLMHGQPKLIFDDTLTILCEITVIKGTVHIDGHSARHIFQEKVNLVSDDLEALFDEQILTNITFDVEDAKYNAHKAILAARSPVFAAMFQSNLIEEINGCVKVVDVSKDVFLETLKFIYSDKVPKLKEMASELLAVAEKYDLKRLKTLSESQLCSDMTVERACELLTLSDMYNAKSLKTYALHFIDMNTTSIIKTDGWAEMKNHTQLFAECCAYIGRHR